MERGSDKHTPRVDEEMGREGAAMETGQPHDSRAEEARRTEGPADDERDASPAGPLTSEGTGREGAVARADLARSLRPSTFPADREALVLTARDEEAPEPVIEALEGLPADRTFGDVEEVWKALGGPAEPIA